MIIPEARLEAKVGKSRMDITPSIEKFFRGLVCTSIAGERDEQSAFRSDLRCVLVANFFFFFFVGRGVAQNLPAVLSFLSGGMRAFFGCVNVWCRVIHVFSVR